MRRFIKRACVCEAVVAALILGLSSVAQAASDAAAAKENYTELCAKCHGEHGKGDGPAAATLTTKPADYTDCARMKTSSDKDLFAVIHDGGPARHLSKDMAPWGDVLEEKEILDLIAYIRSFCQKP